jgi:hypothetical protein
LRVEGFLRAGFFPPREEEKRNKKGTKKKKEIPQKKKPTRKKPASIGGQTPMRLWAHRTFSSALSFFCLFIFMFFIF